MCCGIDHFMHDKNLCLFECCTDSVVLDDGVVVELYSLSRQCEHALFCVEFFVCHIKMFIHSFSLTQYIPHCGTHTHTHHAHATISKVYRDLGEFWKQVGPEYCHARAPLVTGSCLI